MILFNDVVGNAGAVDLCQNGPIGVNVGLTCVVMTILIVAVVAH